MYARGVLAELSGSYGNLLRKRGERRCNAEQAAPGSGGKKAAPFLSEMLASGRFRLYGDGYLLLRPDPAIRISSMGAASRTSAKLKSVPYVPVAAAGRGNIGTSRDGRHVRHRFGGQSCSIGHCRPCRSFRALEMAEQQIVHSRGVPGLAAGSSAARKAAP